MPKVSIIIPNYNGENYILHCLDSIKRMKYSDYEVIIIDNGSKDNSVQLINSYDMSIKLIVNNDNLGFSAAINQGIELAKGRFVALLNNDTEVRGDWLQKLVAKIEEDDRIFSVASKMLRFHNPELIDDAGDLYTIFGTTLKVGDGESYLNYAKDRRVFSSCAGAALYRKVVFDEIGGFDEYFFAYLEDVDIGYRANNYGYINVYCSKAIVYHIGSATTGSRYNSFKVKLSARNNLLLIRKNMPFIALLFHLPFVFMAIFIKHMYFVKKGFGKQYRDGIKEGFRLRDDIYSLHWKKSYKIRYVIYSEWLLMVGTFFAFYSFFKRLMKRVI